MFNILHFGLITLFIVAAFASCMEGQMQQADSDFDTSVEEPSYTDDHPVLLFDEGHNNFHTSTGRYKPFAQVAKNDGYKVEALSGIVTADKLSFADVYVVANAAGSNEAGDSPAFTPEECTIIEQWVTKGGSLLLIADHFPFGSAAQVLGDKFGLHFQGGSVQDSMHYDTASDNESQLVFSKQNGLLVEHPITEGISKVISFTGQSIKCMDTCFAFMVLSPSAYDLEATSKVIQDGNDTRVEVNYVNPSSAFGRTQGVALSHGNGRVVAMGEAALLTAQKMKELKFGMNYHPENKQLLLNILHWLTD